MGLWGPSVFRKHCHVKLNKLISIQPQEFSTMTSQPLVKKQTALCTTSIPHNDDNSTARFIPFGHNSTEISINDGLSRRRSSRQFQEWSQCHVWSISVPIYYVFRTYLKEEDEWDSLASKSRFYVKFGVGIGQCSFHFGWNRKRNDLTVV